MSRARDEVPTSTPSPYEIKAPGESVKVYEGKANITFKGKTFSAHTRFELDWFPRPDIRCIVPPFSPQPDVKNPLFSAFMGGLQPASLELDDGTRIKRMMLGLGKVSTRKLTFSMQGYPGMLVQRYSGKDATYALFLLPNFDQPTGECVRVGRTFCRDRNRLVGGGWSVLLDGLESETCPLKHVSSRSGYAVTAIGRVQRSDGGKLVPIKTVDFATALNWYFSFVSGQWTGPFLLKCFSESGEPVWEAWYKSRVSPFRNVRSWMNGHPNDQFAGPFPGFMDWWGDRSWRDPLTTAIHWYIEANNQAGSIEGAIILTQTAFELLSSVIVERQLIAKPPQFDKLPAAARIRHLFKWANLPENIPASCKALLAIRNGDVAIDVATVMTKIRNTITHPKAKHREEFKKHTDQARIETWQVGLWALELCILKLCKYQGTYSNRLIHTRAWEEEPVPWARFPGL